MTTALIKVKLQVPPIRSKWVQRPNLIRRLNSGMAQKLILVSASAGYGKSTLLNEWAHQLTVPVAWFSLDDSDNSPSRFWAYFTSALQTLPGLGDDRVGDGLLNLDGSPHSSYPEDALARLVDEVSQSSVPLILILDDLHLITSSTIHKGLVFLLDHLPASVGGLHLVVSSRMDPPWPLARMRARAELAELRTRDLRFTSQESTEFLNHSMGLQISEPSISRLDQRTEGWIAGLQMAALSIRKLEDIPSFLDRFSGSQRYIMDYLIEEVLNHQPPDIQDFLLKTSILEKMTAPLCDVVTGISGSQEMLIQLEKSNVFVASLDDDLRWFRYHTLFADLLQRRLEHTYPDQLMTLHRRAAEFFKGEGLFTEMVSHAIGGKDYDSLIRLLATDAYTIRPLDISHIAEQLRSLPDETKRIQPWVLIVQAWALVQSGFLNEVEPCLQKAEESLNASSPRTEAEQSRMKGHIFAIRGYSQCLQDDMPMAVEILRASLAILPPEDSATRSLAATVLSTSLRWSGHLEEGARYGEEAVAMARVSGSVNALVDVQADFAILQILQGRLSRAEETCLNAMRVAEEYRRQTGKNAPILGPIYTAYSVILRERNDIGNALDYAREGLQLCQQWGQAANIFRSYYDLAKAFQVSGDSENAERTTRDAERIAGRISPWFVMRAAMLRLWLNIKVGNIPAVFLWAQENGITGKDAVTFETYELYCLLAKAYLAERKWKEALELLRKLLRLAESSGAIGYMAEIQALQAVAKAEPSLRGDVKGSLDSAMKHLKKALALAEPEGFVRIFADIGAPLSLLLRQAASRDISPSYANLLLDAIEADQRLKKLPRSEWSGVKDGKPPSQLEPLSERELEVLKLLNSQLSVPEIANELSVAPSTVRTHVRVIYGKLGAHGRMEAIQKAREVGLI